MGSLLSIFSPPKNASEFTHSRLRMRFVANVYAWVVHRASSSGPFHASTEYSSSGPSTHPPITTLMGCRHANHLER